MCCLLLEIQSFLAGYTNDEYEYIKEEDEEEDEDQNINSKKKIGITLNCVENQTTDSKNLRVGRNRANFKT